MKRNPGHHLNKLKQTYLLLRSAEIVLLALAAACLVVALTSFFNISPLLRLTMASASATTVFAILLYRSRLYKFDTNRLVAFIDHHYPVMQHSTDLLLKDVRTLTSLEQIQKEKICRHFEQIFTTIKLPHDIGKALTVLAASGVLTAALLLFVPQIRDPLQQKSETAAVEAAPSSTLAASVTALTVKVAPPPYTGKASYTTNAPDLSIPEGSVVRWEIAFSDTVQNAMLLFARSDSLPLSVSRQNYIAQRSFSQSDIYQLSWKPADAEQQTSGYFKADVIPDQPPKIAVPLQPEYKEISVDDKQNVPVKVDLADDYGLSEAHIIATVSKGSGESIKFREEKLPFMLPARIHGRRAEARQIIDLKALGLEPGDELYFYVEALDNKKPSANHARTQTYVISLPDTSSQVLSVEAGLGVDLMPAYFRSQRQIIIDSEKLLREQKSIGEQQFNSRSDEIAHDQKVLRLRYGQFLGEEFETNIGRGPDAHESDNEEHHQGEADEDEADPTEAYKHIHDDPEEATFFTESIRAKLKAALAAMWNAELHLRTFDVKRSLPHQYVALRILKDISQDSRIYVHRTGFDPPPLKEENRLTGNLADIRNTAHKRDVSDSESYPAVRSALGIVEEWLTRPDSFLTPTARKALLHAGQELAVPALNEPGTYLHALSVIKSLSENETEPEDLARRLLFLRRIFWKVLPEEMAAADKNARAYHDMDRAFINNMKSP